MNKEERLARDRIRNVDKTNVGKVLGNSDTYWNLPFIREFLERIDVLLLEEPLAAYEFGRVAPELVRLTRMLNRPEGFSDSVEAKSWQARAHASRGSTCRVLGKLQEAEQEFGRAFAVMGAEAPGVFSEDAGVDLYAQAEVHRRYAALLASTQRDPMPPLDHAIAVYRQEDLRAGLATALQLRAAYKIGVKAESGMKELAEALSLANLRTSKGRRTANGILQNMLLHIARVDGTISDCQRAIVALQAAKKRTERSRPSIAKASVYWVEGLLLAKVGLVEQAFRCLEQARTYLRKLREPTEFALVSLDTAILYLASGRGRAAANLALETEDVLRTELRAEENLLNALASWTRCSVVGPHMLRKISASISRSACP